jgi:putative ABC transport system permease protein
VSFSEISRNALSEVRHHKLRSSLTLLGIVLGTLSITVMTSFLDGIVATVWQGFEDLGFDGVVYVVNREARDLREAAVFTRSKGLQPSDAEVLLSRRRIVAAVAPMVYDEALVRRGSAERKARVMGVTPGYALVRNRRMASGRFFTDSDERSFAKVCVLGHRLKQRLFGSEDPVDKTLTIGGRPFRVVGVGQKLGNQFVNDDEFIEEMEGIYVPLVTLRKLVTGEQAPLSIIAVRGASAQRLGDLVSEVTASLKSAHRGAEDFRVLNIAQEIVRARSEVTELLRNWRIVLGSIAGISLLVGGIGLLSVMLISIGERLFEIGLRKAIGATDAEIFVQFLLEAVVLSLVGGLLGAAAGIGITKAASGFFPSGLPIHLGGLALAIGVALLLGVLYGIYPALKAARMVPVEALTGTYS